MRLGGSTIAAAVGVDPFVSPVELYLRLTGRIEDEAGEPAEWGRRLEPVIFEALRERGIPAEPVDLELVDEARPWLVGHPDGRIEGEPTLVEAKLTGPYMYRREAELPLTWQAQAQTYLALSDNAEVLVAVLHGGTYLDLRRVVRNERQAELLLELAERFMGYVERGELPPPGPTESEARALARAFEAEEGRAYRLTSREELELVDELRRRRRQRDALADQVRELENRVKALEPRAEVFLGPEDEPVATWSSYSRRAVDVKRLREDRPEVAEEYTTETKTRRFTLHD